MTPKAKPKIRLYVPADYRAGYVLELGAGQAHYLLHVMRLTQGDVLTVFNGEEGEWLAEVTQVRKKSVTLTLKSRYAAQIYSPEVWFAFAPIKNKTELVVEKATELGVTKILPVFMKHSVVTRVNMDKLTAHAIEAAEQCERMDVPVIEEQKNLQAMLGAWPKDRLLLYGDESGGGTPLGDILYSLSLGGGKYGILIGPEGGFAGDERQLLAACDFVKPFGMGPRILRADTAAVVALSCLISRVGDWQRNPRFEVSHG